MIMQATRETTKKIVEEVRNTYVSAEFNFCITPEKEADLQVAIMDANEELSQRDYPCWVTKEALNIDGTATFKCNVEQGKVNKKVYKNGVIWGTAKFDTEDEYEKAAFELFGTDYKITSEETEEEIPDGLVRCSEENSDEE